MTENTTPADNAGETTEQAQPERPEDSAIVELASATMTGDLLTALVDELKAAPDVWPKLSQHKQDAIIDRFHRRIGEAIKEAVRMIASDNRPTIRAKLEQLVSKDGIKAVLTIAQTDPQRHDLLDAVGQRVLLLVADADQYGGGERPVPDKDQPDLPIADAGAAGAEPAPTAEPEAAAPDPETNPAAPNP